MSFHAPLPIPARPGALCNESYRHVLPNVTLKVKLSAHVTSFAGEIFRTAPLPKVKRAQVAA